MTEDIKVMVVYESGGSVKKLQIKANVNESVGDSVISLAKGAFDLKGLNLIVNGMKASFDDTLASCKVTAD